MFFLCCSPQLIVPRLVVLLPAAADAITCDRSNSRFLEGGVALQLSPADVNVAVRIIEKLALSAPPASLGYGSGAKQGARSATDWPSTVIPALNDEAFGIRGETLRPQREVLSKYFGAGGGSDAAASASGGVAQGTTAAPPEDSNEGLDVNFGAGGFDPSGYGPLQTGQPSVASEREVVNKPSLCLVMGDALGADLLRWCTTVCRSRQWREIFSVEPAVAQQQDVVVAPPALSQPATHVAGTKRGALVMEVAYCTDPDTEFESPRRTQKMGVPTPPTPSDDPMDEEGSVGQSGGGGSAGEGTSKVREKNRKLPGLAQLLCVVNQVVHAVKEHTKALGAARDRVGAVTLMGEVGGRILEAGSERSFDFRRRETSAAAQAIVGALADAVLDAFADHMADPALHHYLLRSSSTQQADDGRDMRTDEPQAVEAGVAVTNTAATAPGFSRTDNAMVMAEITPLIDGSSPAETVGLSVDLVSDMAWLFSALEPEVDKGTGGGTSRAGPAAANLSSAMSCWASGRILACMPGRKQLTYALGLSDSSSDDGSSDSGVVASQTPVPARDPPVCPLPARLACFAVRTLLENAQDAREEGSGTTDSAAPPPPSLPRAQPSPRQDGGGSNEDMASESEESPAARECNGRPTAFYRVALITEQMPAWRQSWRQSGVDGIEEATAGPFAAAEVLDALAAVMCAAAEHERVTAAKLERVEAAGAQRRPTRGNAGTIGHVIGPALQAISVLLSGESGGGSARASAGPGGSNAASLRSSMLARVKKRRAGSVDNGGSAAQGTSPASDAAKARWRALAGLHLPASLDRVHLSAFLLAWEPWHPWMEKGSAPSVGPPSGSGATARTMSVPFRQSRSWQTFSLLTDELAQACVASRAAPLLGKALAALVTRTVVSFRAAPCGRGDPLPCLDMPAVLVLCKAGGFSFRLTFVAIVPPPPVYSITTGQWGRCAIARRSHG